MGQHWDVDEIVERALQEDDPQAMDAVIARLANEEKLSRATLLRRGAAAGVGLTILSAPAVASARGLQNPPLRGKNQFATILREAKKEGQINTIALPPDWANYGEIMRTFQRKYGLKLTNDNPDGSSAQENQAVRSLKGDRRAPDVLDVSPSFAIEGANEGLYAKYFNRYFGSVPRSMKDGRGFWVADYYGVVSFGVNRAVVSTIPRTWADLLKPEYKNRVALNGSPLSSGSAQAGVHSAAIANGGSLGNISPGIEFFKRLKDAGNFIPVQATPQTIASGQTPIVVDWDYLNLAYVKEFPSARIAVSVPSDGVYGAHYCQAINATAPHPWAARLWQEFLYSDAGQLLWLKGFSHPARFADMTKRKVIPAALLRQLPTPALYSKVRFATSGQLAAAKEKLASEWPKLIG